MNHTLGPWEIKTVNTQVGHCHKIMPIGACLYVDNQTLPRDAVNYKSQQALADAHLIAAAPDLLKILKAATDALRSYQYGNCSSALAEGIADMAEAIIKKVEVRP